MSETDTILAATKARDMRIENLGGNLQGWRRDLSDGTHVLMTFGDGHTEGDLDAWDWYVAHCDADGDEIGGGDWDFAGALKSVDGYIAEPGWDRGESTSICPGCGKPVTVTMTAPLEPGSTRWHAGCLGRDLNEGRA